MRAVALAMLAMLAGCGGERPALVGPDGRLRVVAIEGTAAVDPGGVDLVVAFAPDLAVAMAGRARTIGVGAGAEGVRQQGLTASVELPLPIDAAGALAELLLRGATLPPAIELGTRVWNADNAAAGGRPVVAPGDIMLKALQAEAGNATATGGTDESFGIALLAGDDHGTAQAALQAAVKGRPRLHAQPTTPVTAAAAAGRLAELVAQGTRVVLIDDAVADPSLAGPAAAARRQGAILIGVGRVDPAFPPDSVACVVHASPEIVGRAAADEVRRLLDGRGRLLLLRHGDQPVQERLLAAFAAELDLAPPR